MLVLQFLRFDKGVGELADNKRFVSYMYEYKNDEKLNNVGFARIEARNNQCKVFIHISLSEMDGKLLKAYMFYRKPTKSRFAYLGNILIQDGGGELKVKSDRNNVMNSDLDLEDMCGVIIYKDRQSFVACEWDGQPITNLLIDSIENLDLAGNRTVTVETENGKLKDILVEPHLEEPIRVVDYQGQVVEDSTMELDEMDSQLDEPNLQREEINPQFDKGNLDIIDTVGLIENIRTVGLIEDIETVESNKEDSYLMEASEICATTATISMEEQSQPSYNNAQMEWIATMAKNIQELFLTPGISQGAMNQGKESVHESADVGIQLQNSAAIQEDLYTNRDYYKDHAVVNQMKEYRNIGYEQQIRSESVGMECPEIECVEPTYESPQVGVGESSEESQLSEGLRKFECHPIAQNIFRRFPRVYPFEDNEIFDCVRIEPQDIGLLPIEAWVLGNNSFLLHGYYTYRHLIFGKIMSPNGFIYVLGVPGVYQSRERFMAHMFGFDYFKCVKLTEEKNGEFGYYYLPVQLG